MCVRGLSLTACVAILMHVAGRAALQLTSGAADALAPQLSLLRRLKLGHTVWPWACHVVEL